MNFKFEISFFFFILVIQDQIIRKREKSVGDQIVYYNESENEKLNNEDIFTRKWANVKNCRRFFFVIVIVVFTLELRFIFFLSLSFYIRRKWPKISFL